MNFGDLSFSVFTVLCFCISTSASSHKGLWGHLKTIKSNKYETGNNGFRNGIFGRRNNGKFGFENGQPTNCRGHGCPDGQTCVTDKGKPICMGDSTCLDLGCPDGQTCITVEGETFCIEDNPCGDACPINSCVLTANGYACILK